MGRQIQLAKRTGSKEQISETLLRIEHDIEACKETVATRLRQSPIENFEDLPLQA